MIELLRWLFQVRYPYPSEVERERASTLLTLTLLIGGLWMLSVAFIILPQLFNPESNALLNAFYIILLLPFGLITALIQLGRLRIAIVVFMLLTLAPIPGVLTLVNNPLNIAVLIVPLLAGMLLLDRPVQIALIALIAATFAVRLILQTNYTRTIRFTPAENVTNDLVTFGSILGLTAVFTLIVANITERFSRRAANARAFLSGVGSFRGSVSGIYDDERIFVRALELVQRTLGYTLASAYRLNESGSFTRLRLGGIGQDIVRTDIRLSEDMSGVGEAARRLDTIIVSNLESGTRSAHILAPARWSMSIPIMREGILLGVLDVQTAQPDGFSEDERDGFHILAEQIAGALLDAREIQEFRRISREQDEQLERYREQLGQVEQRSRQALASAWDRYVQVRTSVGEIGSFGFDLQRAPSGSAITPASDLPPDIREALSSGDIHIGRNERGQIVHAPVIFRGEVLGAMTFQIPQGRVLSERQIDMLRAITSRLGIALENNRLFEQSQALAQRERRASEIGSLLISATDIESVLNLAARSFNEALGAISTRVIVENPDPNPSSANGNSAVNGHHNGNGSHNGNHA
jgi:GAF domain-containing protein